MTQATLREIIDRAIATHATTLDISGMNLTELPPEIGKLVHLKTLILGRRGYDEGKRLEELTNNLTTLPPEIGKLTQRRSPPIKPRIQPINR
ncbi:MAG: hypothetical protein SFY66_19985 [Oculatellaceae cyanobacterium bins.114]|nr:hypothetical protein [Oculatellaceae cyanobacterium bins.114]